MKWLAASREWLRGLRWLNAVAAALATGWFEFLREMTSPRLPLEEGDRIVPVRNWDRLAGG